MALVHDRLTSHTRTRARRAAAAGLVALVSLSVAACGSASRRTVAATTVVPSTTTTVVAPAASTTTTLPPAPSTTRTIPPTTEAPVTTTVAPAPTSAATAASSAACPASLAASLASTGGADQLITVEAPSASTTVASVELWQRSGRCWEAAAGPWTGFVGYNGFSGHKREGDGTTPTGIYGIGPVMYGNAANPGVGYAYHLLVCGDWWDENPASAEYNTFQHVPCGQNPFGGDSEALWTETAPYPSFAVVDYNIDPVIPGAGSAIFLHASTGGPTAGCVSVPLADLDLTLRWLNPADSPAIVMGPSSEITDFRAPARHRTFTARTSRSGRPGR
jgi:L,D-peptidoglycan transpeptidase YkuD (ErfK/YbiS/YcfS/YnhG family)